MEFREISDVKMGEININQEIMDFIQFLVITTQSIPRRTERLFHGGS